MVCDKHRTSSEGLWESYVIRLAVILGFQWIKYIVFLVLTENYYQWSYLLTKNIQGSVSYLLTSCHGRTCLDNGESPNIDSQDLLAMILDWSAWADLPRYQILRLFCPEHPQWGWGPLLMESDRIPPKSDIQLSVLRKSPLLRNTVVIQLYGRNMNRLLIVTHSMHK